MKIITVNSWKHPGTCALIRAREGRASTGGPFSQPLGTTPKPWFVSRDDIQSYQAAIAGRASAVDIAVRTLPKLASQLQAWSVAKKSIDAFTNAKLWIDSILTSPVMAGAWTMGQDAEAKLLPWEAAKAGATGQAVPLDVTAPTRGQPPTFSPFAPLREHPSKDPDWFDKAKWYVVGAGGILLTFGLASLFNSLPSLPGRRTA